MAKKLNKKVAFTALIIVGILAVVVAVYGLKYIRESNPEYCLTKATDALAAKDYKTVEAYYGKAYGKSKTDQAKVEILYKLADFHLLSDSEHEQNWRKAIGCWNQIITIEPRNITARRKLLDYFYQYAENGAADVWKYVQEHSGEILKVQGDPNLAEPFILLANGRAALEIARSGSVAYREELLANALRDFHLLGKITPNDADIYGYLAQVAIVDGQLQDEKRLPQAREKARARAMEYLDEGLKAATDKAAAWSLIMQYKLIGAMEDPNQLSPVRKELAALAEKFPGNDRLWVLLGASYERPGKTDRKAEFEKAIKAISRAAEAAPDNVSYRLRLASLMYRKGTIYNEVEMISEAIKTAQQALEMPQCKINSGPKEGLSRQNRFAIQSFLSRAFFEKALEAKSADDKEAFEDWKAKASRSTEEISQIIGSAENIIVMQWQGLMMLLDGRNEQAFRLLYKAYEQSKSLDKPGEPSQIDSYLCYQLSHLARAQGMPGARQEFLERAIFNVGNIATEIPRSLVEYAAILVERRAGAMAERVLDSYIQMYGTNTELELMRVDAAISAGKYELARQRLGKITEQEGTVLQRKLALTNLELGRLRGMQSLGQREEDKKETQQDIERLRNEQNKLLSEMLSKSPQSVDAQFLTAICRDLIANGQTEQAVSRIDEFLAKDKQNSLVLLLKKETQEPDPKNITRQRRGELLEQILLSKEDPKDRAVALGQYYLSMQNLEKAREEFQKAWDLDPENMDIFGNLFGATLDLKDVKATEELFNRVRNKNPDGCDGNLYAAQIDIAKKQYDSALRRLDECLVLKPIFASAHFLKSRVYLLQERFAEAAESAKTAFSLDPMNGMMARQYASVVYERNSRLGGKLTSEQIKEAESALGAAMVLNPDDWQIQSVYAETISLSQPQQALAMRQMLLKNIPNLTNAIMLGNMAKRLAGTQTGESERAALLEIAGSAYQQGCQMEPTNEMATSAYSEFLRQTNQKEKAIQILAQDKKTLGRFYLNDGQYEKARDVLEQALKERPEDLDILRSLAETAEGMGQREQVKFYLDQIIKQELPIEQEFWTFQKYLDAGYNEPVEQRLPDFQKRHPEERRILLLQAWVKMRQGQLEESLKITKQYLELEPDYAPGWHLLGRLYRLMGQPQQAIEALQRSKTLLMNPNIRIELAALYNQNKQVEAAVGELVTGLADPQAPMQMRLLLEQIYVGNQRTSDLTRFYKETLDKYPQSVFWLSKTGMFYLGQKDYPQALSYLEKAWSLSEKAVPPDGGVLNNYLYAMLESGKTEAVISTASKYIDTALAPVAYMQMAMAQTRLKQTDKAMDYFQTAVEKSQSDPAALPIVLETMNSAIGVEPMMNWCRQKLSQNPDFIPANLMLYSLYMRQGQYNKAAEHLDRCLAQTAQQSPQWLDFSMKRGNLLLLAYSKTSDESYVTQAIDHLKKMLMLQPNNTVILNNLAYLLTDSDRDADEAVEYARRAYQSEPENPVFLDTLAYANIRKGRYEYAKQQLQRVVQQYELSRQPVPWDAYKHLGMAFEKLGQNEQALAAYKNALNCGQDISSAEKEKLTGAIQNLGEKP